MDKNIANYQARFEQNDYNVDFISNIKFFKRTVMGKLRKMASLKDKTTYSAFLISKMQEILKPITKLNRSLFDLTRELYNGLNTLGEEYTIVRFDFISYYNTLSAQYIYDYYIKNNIDKKYHPLFEKYIADLNVCKVGLSLSEYFSSIITGVFENELKKQLSKIAEVSINHYTDDFIILLNKNVDKQTVQDIISKALAEVYNKPHDKPNSVKIHLDDDKFSLITSNEELISLNFLGITYCMRRGQKGCTIGLPERRKIAMRNYFYNIVKNNSDKLELLRQMLYVNTRNVVYRDFETGEACQNYLLSYYKLFLENQSNIDSGTVEFLSNVVKNAFIEQSIPLPYYLKDDTSSNGYNLYYNFINRKNITLFEEHGMSKQKLLEFVCYTEKDKLKVYNSLSYQELVKIFIDKFTVPVKKV